MMFVAVGYRNHVRIYNSKIVACNEYIQSNVNYFSIISVYNLIKIVHDFCFTYKRNIYYIIYKSKFLKTHI